MKHMNGVVVAMTSVAVAVVVASCGANDQASLVDGSVLLRAPVSPQTSGTPFANVAAQRSAASSALAATAVRSPTAAEFFNWAELTYPTVFTGKQPDRTLDPYVFRYYPATDIILAVTGASVLGLVGATSATPRVIPLGSLGDFSCLVLPALCNATPAKLDTTSVTTGVAEVSAFINVCSPTPTRSTGVVAAPANRDMASVIARLIALDRMARMVGGTTDTTAQNASANKGPVSRATTAPADSLGSCGGRLSHPAYSDVNGITTATSVYDNYCSTDSATGEKTVMNGRFTYVKTSVLRTGGSDVVKLVANSPDGISYVTKSAAGVQLTAQTFSFTNFVNTPGVVGGQATSTKPDKVQIDEFKIGDATNGKTYRQTGYTMTSYNTADGSTLMGFSGRGYRSDGSFYDLATTTPMVTNSSGDYTGGAFTFSGAGGSKAEATLVPGSTFQVTMTVDGVPVTGVPACVK